MLRYPPSRLDLNASDIREYEIRFKSRQSRWPQQIYASSIRLNAGPRRVTHQAIIPARNNLGQRRAVSSASSATVHSTEDDDHLTVDQLGLSPSTRIAISPPLLSSARTRRRHDFAIAEDTPPELPLRSCSPSDASIPRGTATSPALHVLPTLVLPAEPLEIGSASLDPGAAVFVPHVQLATTGRQHHNLVIRTRVNHSDLENAQDVGHLRLRSDATRNLDAAHGQRAHRLPQAPPSRRHAERHSTVHLHQPNLERYPFLRPTSTGSDQRVHSTTYRPANVPPTRMARMSSAYFPQRSASRQTHVRRVVSTPFNIAAEDAATIRALSSESLMNSLSFPSLAHQQHSLPHVHETNSSLDWNAPAHSHRPTQSTTSQASSNNESRWVPRRYSSDRSSDAATEVLRMRQSPLDELSERLSRFASRSKAGNDQRRQRSESSRHAESEHSRRSSPLPSSDELYMTAREDITFVKYSPNVAQDDHSKDMETRPSSSAIASSPPPLGRASQVLDFAYSSSPPQSDGSPRQEISRKPVLTAVHTPRVKVYDDTQPPHTQPQTVADTQRRPRADTFAGRVRQGIARHIGLTPSSPQTRQPLSSPISPNRQDPFPESSRRERTRRRQRLNQAEDDGENDVEGHLPGLAYDRSTWMSRREREGTLDVTPPREGRFEQYFS